MTEKKLKFWGWGYDDQTLTEVEAKGIAAHISKSTGIDSNDYIAPPQIHEVCLPKAKVSIPNELKNLVSQNDYDRAAHTYGKSYPDYIRAFNRNFESCPDAVAFPTSAEDIIKILEWSDKENTAVIPYGCGSSVVGGVEPRIGNNFSGVITIDMRRMNRVIEVDKISKAARIQAGALGPQLEDGLRPSGLTLRHFPQSFEISTLGGWIATRSGGHFATLYTHIDELVESLSTVTPAGTIVSRRLPGSGAGPSPDRLMIGSEGALGLITEAWVRVHERPKYRQSSVIRFKEMQAAGDALRTLLQTGIWPTNARFVDSEESRLSGVNDGSYHMVLLGFESASQPTDSLMKLAQECMADHGGQFNEAAERDKTADSWREAFIKAPFRREGLIANGIMHDTFETSITWDRLAIFHKEIKLATENAILKATGKPGHVTCRFTHAYPDGTSPYFTFHAQTKPGHELDQWRAIKTAASDALIKAGGTITHHHAVGRDHMTWYEKQRPRIFGEALAAAKTKLDPAGRLNPGVLVPLENDREISLP